MDASSKCTPCFVRFVAAFLGSHSNVTAMFESSANSEHPPNALVQLQAHYHRCGEAASEKCLSLQRSLGGVERP